MEDGHNHRNNYWNLSREKERTDDRSKDRERERRKKNRKEKLNEIVKLCKWPWNSHICTKLRPFVYIMHKHPFASETIIAGQYLLVCACVWFICFLSHAMTVVESQTIHGNKKTKPNQFGQLIPNFVYSLFCSLFRYCCKFARFQWQKWWFFFTSSIFTLIQFSHIDLFLF